MEFKSNIKAFSITIGALTLLTIGIVSYNIVSNNNDVTIESDFDNAIIGFIPQTKDSGFHDWFSPAILYCSVKDCRENTTFIDKNNKTIKIKTSGVGNASTALNNSGDFIIYDNDTYYTYFNKKYKLSKSKFSAPYSIYSTMLSNQRFYGTANMGSKEDNPGSGFYYSNIAITPDKTIENATLLQGYTFTCNDNIYFIEYLPSKNNIYENKFYKYNWDDYQFEEYKKIQLSNFNAVKFHVCGKDYIDLVYRSNENDKFIRSRINLATDTFENDIKSYPYFDKFVVYLSPNQSFMRGNDLLAVNFDGRIFNFPKEGDEVTTELELSRYFHRPHENALSFYGQFKDDTFFAVGQSKHDPDKIIGIVLDPTDWSEIASATLEIPTKEYGSKIPLFDFVIGDTNAVIDWINSQPPIPS
ncbi:hypothetical protein [Stomatohabitans albus]|uniref:hypothetical protein n=1 Tax=Stomatohabitans albus TaxID=3110766 RepID=UPI00300DA303